MASVKAQVTEYVRGHRGLARVALQCLPDWHVHVDVPHAGRMRIRLRRNRSYWLREPLTHEWYPLAILQSFVRPGDTVWDVGANIGLYSRILVNWLGAGRVIAFEPMSENLPELLYNLASGRIADRVTVCNVALSDRDGEAAFQIDDMQSASGSLDAVLGGDASAGRASVGLPPKTERVICRSIDSLLDEGALPAPDVMKVDVEGAERLLLDGGRRFLSSGMPRLLIETHGVRPIRECLAVLFEHGYAIAGCVPDRWHPDRHQRLTPNVLESIADQYDVHFIAAAKDPRDLPSSITRQVEAARSASGTAPARPF